MQASPASLKLARENLRNAGDALSHTGAASLGLSSLFGLLRLSLNLHDLGFLFFHSLFQVRHMALCPFPVQIVAVSAAHCFNNNSGCRVSLHFIGDVLQTLLDHRLGLVKVLIEQHRPNQLVNFRVGVVKHLLYDWLIFEESAQPPLAPIPHITNHSREFAEHITHPFAGPGRPSLQSPAAAAVEMSFFFQFTSIHQRLRSVQPATNATPHHGQRRRKIASSEGGV
eukprot:1402872-Rhodomonas_salina.3